MKNLLFIYNPHAGRQRVRTDLADILDVFASQGYVITAHPTLQPGDATRVAAQSGGYDRVVCCGGDGTLNETVTGLMRLPKEERPALGYIPTGTTNDFARNIHLPKDMTEMARVACGDRLRTCDLGMVDGRYFTYVAAFGLFTDVSYTTPQNTKNMLGHFAYVLEGAGRLANIPAFHMVVETDQGVRVEDDYIYGMVGNTVSVGGLVNLPRDKVQLDDGVFEVLLIRQPKNPMDLTNILTALTTQTLVDGGAVTGFPASRVTFTCDQPVSWTLDGEFGGERNITVIENIHQAYMLACGSET
jgi:YegS/Rv2252/BmrU family lipid kinase